MLRGSDRTSHDACAKDLHLDYSPERLQHRSSGRHSLDVRQSHWAAIGICPDNLDSPDATYPHGVMSILSELSTIVGDAFESAGVDPAYGQVVVSSRPDLGQFQCNGALPAAKQANTNPRTLADNVVGALGGDPRFTDISLAGPGFINLTVGPEFIGTAAELIRTADSMANPLNTPVKVIIDYGGPNVAKELHVGHLRPAIIGESFKRMIRYAGHEVTGDVHLGDWGTPMGQLIVELQRNHPDLPYFDPDHTSDYPKAPPVTVQELNDLYPIASRRAKQDESVANLARLATTELQEGRRGYVALWNHFRSISIEAMRAIYGELGVHFDRWHGESTVHDRIAAMVDRLRSEGVAVESDGALIITVAEEGDTRDIPPLILVKSDGGYNYHTTDLATIDGRIEEGFVAMFYFVDSRQSDHFEQLFRAARLGGIASEDIQLEHAGNGTVNGRDGRPLKTRDGNLPLLREAAADARRLALERMDERGLAVDYPDQERREVARLVGLAALKYGDLRNHRASNYKFDLERFTSFEGKTGPYLLYGAVRMKSILREAKGRGLDPGPIGPPQTKEDTNLMLRLLQFPEVLARAIEHRAPNQLAEHAYEIVADFNRFYETCHILEQPDEELRSTWLGLVDLAHRQLTTVLDLLTIEVPERM
ncbi:MAG TPA: arginine--tRNA ligase, partial [Actinobacteria bacterium]|nr:arginine--tRNA ligase [Actinomycetota bacterium]